MKAQFEEVPKSDKESFVLRSYDLPRFAVPWHFHPELELTLILEGGGDRCVGDHLGPFSAGDLVLVGSELPHYWHSHSQSEGARARALVVHFRPEAFGSGFYDLPELTAWRDLLTSSRRGLHFQGPSVVVTITSLLETMPTQSKARRLLTLWEILECLSVAMAHASPLASEHYLPSCDRRTSDRLGRVYEHIYANLADTITLAQVAAVAGMSEAAFSRHFKKVTGRTLTKLINDLRAAQVCKQLIDTDLTVTEIAFSAGFQSVSNFNRVFLETQGVNPQNYRKQRLALI